MHERHSPKAPDFPSVQWTLERDLHAYCVSIGRPLCCRSAMSALRNIILMFLCLSMSPGLFEAFEDVAHVLRDGGTGHADGHESGEEHGCSSTSHQCDCCVSMAATLVVTTTNVGTALFASEGRAQLQSGLCATAFHARIERPPAV